MIFQQPAAVLSYSSALFSCRSWCHSTSRIVIFTPLSDHVRLQFKLHYAGTDALEIVIVQAP